MAASGVRFKANPKAGAELARGDDMRRTVERVASDAADNAQRLAPRASGRLADSIAATSERTSDGWVGVVYFGEWYGKLWEFGHRGRSKPFLRPGTQQALAKVGGRFSSKRK